MIALTRAVSPALFDCELTHLERSAIEVRRAMEQHAAYERALEALGWGVRQLPAGECLPDCVFIEDTAVVFDEVAVLTRPGAFSRRPEVPVVAEALAGLRPLQRIEGSATLDGGDVLVAGRTVFVGRSSRTNTEGIEQLRAIVAPFGYMVKSIGVRGCLHLKSAVTALDQETLLVNPSWIALEDFAGFEHVTIDPSEAFAANVLNAGTALVCAAGFPKTERILQSRGYRVEAVDVSELQKAEGAVTCCSLLIR